MTILYGILIFWAGMFVGFVLHIWMIYKFKYYSGTLVVDVDDRDKIIYTLVLDDYPEELKFKKVIALKVDAPAESSDRE
jgi:hypothetical protein